MERVVDIQSIVDSVQVPLLLKDAKVKQMSFVRDSLGNLLRWPGGYAVVFHLTSPSGQWAFRCLHTPLSNISYRLKAISNYFKSVNLPYFCDFDYNECGLIADGERIPTSTMRWVDGEKLSDFIFAHSDRPTILATLAQNFLTMCKAMSQNKIAHGDMQHDNILVSRDASLYLIDYDSVYVPTLKGYSDIIAGKPNYQHPKRKSNNYASEKLDYFSELVIYLSLLAFSKRPSLIREFNIIEKEQLLFCKEDYSSVSAFRNSKGYHQAIALGGECPKLVAILERYLKCNSIDELKPFWTYEVPNAKIVFTLSDVCGKCGRSYYAKDDLYCIYCGIKRTH